MAGKWTTTTTFYFFSSSLSRLLHHILPFTAGGFLNIALVSVVPPLMQASRICWQDCKLSILYICPFITFASINNINILNFNFTFSLCILCSDIPGFNLFLASFLLYILLFSAHSVVVFLLCTVYCFSQLLIPYRPSKLNYSHSHYSLSKLAFLL
jgi:hypothetical protein